MNQTSVHNYLEKMGFGVWNLLRTQCPNFHKSLERGVKGKGTYMTRFVWCKRPESFPLSVVHVLSTIRACIYWITNLQTVFKNNQIATKFCITVKPLNSAPLQTMAKPWIRAKCKPNNFVYQFCEIVFVKM